MPSSSAARRHAPLGSVVVAAVPGASTIPLLADRDLVDGRAAAYVCRNLVCQRPVTSVEDLVAQLGGSARQVGVCPAGDEGKVEVGLDAGRGGAHVGDRVDAVGRGHDEPGLRTRPSSMVLGCQPWIIAKAGGSPWTSTSKRWPSGPSVQAGRGAPRPSAR